MGGRFVAKELAFEILNVWLNTDFSEGRHQQRINKISNIEKEQI
jgi:ribose 5-phosphate isomerase B